MDERDWRETLNETVANGSARAALTRGGACQAAAALAAAGLFFAVLTANLCFPTPQGPADNGDFIRITSQFSIGPQGFEYTRRGDHERDSERYFAYYYRYWLLQRPDDTRLHVPTSSSLLFFPGRFLDANAPPGYLDLTFNTFVLIAILASAVFFVFRGLPPRASLPLGFLATVVLADAGVSSYLNSFYQESGGYFFTALFVCALAWWWSRDNWPSFVAVLATGVLAMASKRPLTIAVAIVVIVVTGAGMKLSRFKRRSLLRFLLAFAVMVGAGLAVNRVSTLPLHTKVYCYSSIFDGMLPSLPEDQRGEFLRAVGLPESFASLSGTVPHGEHTPFNDMSVREAMSGGLQERAVMTFIARYPASLIRLFRRVLGAAGRYEVPSFGYRGRDYSPVSQDLGALHVWTSVRARVLRGWIGYAAGAVLIAVLFAASGSKEAPRSPAVLRWGCVAFYLASASQIPIVALGDGGLSLPKALYFANLYLDIAFILAIVAIGVVVSPQLRASFRRVSGAANEIPGSDQPA